MSLDFRKFNYFLKNMNYKHYQMKCNDILASGRKIDRSVGNDPNYDADK